jgi:hypothetical protein
MSMTTAHMGIRCLRWFHVGPDPHHMAGKDNQLPFTIVFSEEVTGVAAGDVTLTDSLSGTSTAVVTPITDTGFDAAALYRT